MLSAHSLAPHTLMQAENGMELDIHAQTTPRLSEHDGTALRSELVADTAQQLLDMLGTQHREASCRLAAVRDRARARAGTDRAGLTKSDSCLVTTNADKF